MGRVIVMNHVSLDGVMQGPGRADEDARDGFDRGGWAIVDAAASEAWGRRMATAGGLGGWLLGRRTYDDVLGYWTQVADSPFGAALVAADKYVASTTMKQPRWPNTTVLRGDVAAEVARLKERIAGALVIMGSGQLIAGLLRRDLIDEFLLMINPIVLGSGRRLFAEGAPFARFNCTEATRTPGGLLIASYERL